MNDPVSVGQRAFPDALASNGAGFTVEELSKSFASPAATTACCAKALVLPCTHPPKDRSKDEG
jgi:hypothetical protein